MMSWTADDSLKHSAKGQTWKNHKYIKKVGNQYIYDVKSHSSKKNTPLEIFDDGINAVIELNEARHRDPPKSPRLAFIENTIKEVIGHLDVSTYEKKYPLLMDEAKRLVDKILGRGKGENQNGEFVWFQA